MSKAPKQINSNEKLKNSFSRLLLGWNRDKNRREMPWKGEKDPYKIWLSEIILQQTRVDQGLEYYNRFIRKYPDVRKLARAPDDEVMKLWEGLGYYSRCRNLLFSARLIAKEFGGKFPTTYESILSLKGVGTYTAAAIGSFAFNLPHAVIDGNVFRVLARVFGISTPTDSTTGKKLFTELAQELLDKGQPGIYNQAIMDFGATICKPALPLCEQCVFNKVCEAYLSGRVNELPVKEKKTRMRKRWFYYFVIEHKGKIAIRQRTSKDIWQLLYEFPMMESEADVEQSVLVEKALVSQMLSPEFELRGWSPIYQQKLSHQDIKARFLMVVLKTKPKANDWRWVSNSELKELAFPQVINRYLEGGKSTAVLF